MDQLTDKPISVDEAYDKAVADAKAAVKAIKRKYTVKPKRPQPDLSGDAITMPITPYTSPRKRIAFKQDYSEEWGKKICMLIMMGETLETIETYEGMPSHGTMQWWLINNPVFKATYARACVYRADQFEEEIISLSTKAAQPENYLAVRGIDVKIKTLQWLMARMHRKKWGDHITVDVTPVDLTAMDREASETFMKLLNQMTPKAGQEARPDPIEAEDIPTKSET